jgi:hypothetical protein
MSKLQEFIPSGDFIPVAKTNSDPTYTALSGDLVLADSSGGVITVNLPASPEAGDRVLFQDSKQNWSTNNLTVGRNGSNIDGSASDYTGDGTVNIVEMIYSGDATVGWIARTGGASAGPSVGDYGYILGGGVGGYVSTIERLTFPFDSGTASVIGNLSAEKGSIGGCNSSEYGYGAGGFTSNPSVFYYSAVDRFAFSFDSGTTTVTGNLSLSTRNTGNYNSSNHGFLTGGYVGSFQSNTKRFTFPLDSGIGETKGNISYSAEGIGGCNSSNYGYVAGGNTTMYFTPIHRATFPFDSGSLSNVGNLSSSRGWFHGCNSSQHGFFIAGYDGTLRRSIIDRFAFPFDSGTASHVGNINITGSNTTCINSSEYGYSIGGSNAGGSYSTVERFAFPFASGTASVVGNLSNTNNNAAGVDETDFINMFV